jgi:uncharacterized membrane protein
MTYWGDHMGAGAWVFSILATLIIVALIVGVIMSVVQNAGDKGGSGHTADVAASSREILDRRLASGELTVEQYKELRETIKGSTPDGHATGPPRTTRASG